MIDQKVNLTVDKSPSQGAHRVLEYPSWYFIEQASSKSIKSLRNKQKVVSLKSPVL